MTRRFAGSVLFPHRCCFHCSICRWFRLGEGMGRSTYADKAQIGERWYLVGEWRRKMAAWKLEGDTVGAVNQAVDAALITPAPFGMGTGPAAPAAVYPNPHN